MQDIEEVVIRNKHTFQPPEDLPFEDLSSMGGPNANGGSGSTGSLRALPLKVTKRKARRALLSITGGPLPLALLFASPASFVFVDWRHVVLVVYIHF